jgi:hypothetical protein
MVFWLYAAWLERLVIRRRPVGWLVCIPHAETMAGGSMTAKELADLLASNPDVQLVDHNAPSPSAVAQTGRRNKYNAKPEFESEHALQVAIIAECDRRALHNPAWSNIFAIPNGGHRHPAVAGKLKAEGVRAGIPDLFCALPKHGYAGLFLELKHGGNKTTELQREWIVRLQDAGYFVAVCWDFDTAIQRLIWYVEG